MESLQFLLQRIRVYAIDGGAVDPDNNVAFIVNHNFAKVDVKRR